MSPRSPELVTIVSALVSPEATDEHRASVMRANEDLLREESTDGVLAVLHTAYRTNLSLQYFMERLRVFLHFLRNDGYRGRRQPIVENGFPVLDRADELEDFVESTDASMDESVQLIGNVLATLMMSRSWTVRRHIVAAFPDVLLEGPRSTLLRQMREQYEGYSGRAMDQLLAVLERARTDGLDAAFPVTLPPVMSMRTPFNRGPAYFTEAEAQNYHLQEYLHTPTWDRRINLIRVNQELLLTRRACDSLAELARGMPEGQASWISTGLAKLEECLEVGVDAAFSGDLPPTYAPFLVNPELYLETKGQTDLSDPRVNQFQVEVFRQQMFCTDPDIAPAIRGQYNIFLLDLMTQFPEAELGPLYGEEAILHGYDALETFEHHADFRRRCSTRTLLGKSYTSRVRGDRVENAAKAIEHLDAGLAEARERQLPGYVATAATNLAEVFFARPVGVVKTNRDMARTLSEEVLDLPPDQMTPSTRARACMTYAQLSVPLAKRGDEGARRAGVRRIREAMALLESRRQRGLLCFARQTLALLALARSAIPGPPEYQLCVHHLRRSLRSVSPEEYPLEWGLSQFMLGTVHGGYAELDPTQRPRAYEHLRAALAVFNAGYPYLRTTVLSALAELYFDEARWDECRDILVALIGIGDFTEGMPLSPAGLLVEIAHTTEEHEKLSYCSYRLGRTTDALLELEAGKGRLRRRARADEPWRAGFGDGALVLPLITTHGGVVFVITFDGNEPVLDEIPLDGFSSVVLRGLLVGSPSQPGWLRTYARWRNAATTQGTATFQAATAAWSLAIVRTCALVWTLLMGPVRRRLVERGVQEGASVVILASPWLNLLPLGAAGIPRDGTVRYFSDDYVVSFAPNLASLADSKERAARATPPASLLAVVDPTGDLPGTRAEWEEIRKIAPAAMSLRGDEATPANLTAALAGRGQLHLACHASFGWSDVDESGLRLAGGHRLTLREIAGLPLDTVRLVTLAACETGVVENERTPNEFIGLATAFLNAGVPAVVSSLWSISDEDTSPLMAAFYRCYFHEGRSPAMALKRAQEHVRSLPGRAHPYYWAGFICLGA